MRDEVVPLTIDPLPKDVPHPWRAHASQTSRLFSAKGAPPRRADRTAAGPDGAALEDEWVDAGKFGRGEIYVFGRSDSDSVAVAFLRRDRGADGELPVILFDARGIVERYASLPDYLRARRAWFVAALAS